MQTNRRQKLSAAIRTAIDCVPPELIRITTDYITERPHTFTSTSPTVVVVNPTETETKIESTNRAYPFPWQPLVSASGFDDGHLEWTVEFGLSINQEDIGWIAVGVTASDKPSDRPTAIEDAATADDWLLFPSEERNLIRFAHNEMMTNTTVHTYRYLRFDFAAEPRSGIVTARVWRRRRLVDAWTAIPTVLALIAASTIDRPIADMPLLTSLRPCIVVCGCFSAVVRSGCND